MAELSLPKPRGWTYDLRRGAGLGLAEGFRYVLMWTSAVRLAQKQ